MRRIRPGPAEVQAENGSLPAGSPGLEWVRSFEGAPDAYGIDWSADGAFMAATGTEGGVTVWSAADDRPRSLTGHDASMSVMGLAWHPSHSTLATASDDQTVRLWDVSAGTSGPFCTLEAAAKGVAWSPDGSRLAVTDNNGMISIWDVQERSVLQQARVHKETIRNLRWSADGQLLATCSVDKTINILAANDLRRKRKFLGPGELIDITLSPDGSLIVSASDDRTVRIWELRRQARKSPPWKGILVRYSAARFSPGGDFIASAADR